MTDVEMSLSHKDKDIEMCLAKFDSDKDSNGATETPETDPLALDDEEKMELEEEEKYDDVETNGTQIVQLSLPSPNDKGQTESPKTESPELPEELPVNEQPSMFLYNPLIILFRPIFSLALIVFDVPIPTDHK